MRILQCQVQNFGSYKELEFDFESQGLSLIAGATGSGKSTLCDIIPWCLFGRTAKDGAVDEIRSWNASGPTKGTILLETPAYAGKIEITRIRGTAKDNDLFYSIGPGVEKRGKDLNDTQQQINALLSITPELYLSGAYFHEFSQTASFFTATAKQRRQLTEQFVDLRLAKSLTEKIADYKKEVNLELTRLDKDLVRKSDKLEWTKTSFNKEEQNREQWEKFRYDKIANIDQKRHSFKSAQANKVKELKNQYICAKTEIEYDKAELEKAALPEDHFDGEIVSLQEQLTNLGEAKCTTCGALANSQERLRIMKASHTLELQKSANQQIIVKITNTSQRLDKLTHTYMASVESEQLQKNPYLDQLKELRTEVNPYMQSSTLQLSIESLQNEIQQLKKDIDVFKVELADLELLTDIINDFRALLVKNTISELEGSANKMLTDYFHGEIRVLFDIVDADKLEVTILKDGNECQFTQLSKGQRQLLKLSFGLSVMKSVANHHGIQFSTIFMDEAFDGLDESLKVKAFTLLQSLEKEYESVFVVEHSTELKTRFNKQFQVELLNGESKVCLL